MIRNSKNALEDAGTRADQAPEWSVDKTDIDKDREQSSDFYQLITEIVENAAPNRYYRFFMVLIIYNGSPLFLGHALDSTARTAKKTHSRVTSDQQT